MHVPTVNVYVPRKKKEYPYVYGQTHDIVAFLNANKNFIDVFNSKIPDSTDFLDLVKDNQALGQECYSAARSLRPQLWQQ